MISDELFPRLEGEIVFALLRPFSSHGEPKGEKPHAEERHNRWLGPWYDVFAVEDVSKSHLLHLQQGT